MRCSDAEARNAAREQATVRVYRPGEEAAAVRADALYWDAIPLDERAEFVWQLSLELYAVSNPNTPYEPGLSRSVARVVRS